MQGKILNPTELQVSNLDMTNPYLKNFFVFNQKEGDQNDNLEKQILSKRLSSTDSIKSTKSLVYSKEFKKKRGFPRHLEPIQKLHHHQRDKISLESHSIAYTQPDQEETVSLSPSYMFRSTTISKNSEKRKTITNFEGLSSDLEKSKFFGIKSKKKFTN